MKTISNKSEESSSHFDLFYAARFVLTVYTIGVQTKKPLSQNIVDSCVHFYYYCYHYYYKEIHALTYMFL